MPYVFATMSKAHISVMEKMAERRVMNKAGASGNRNKQGLIADAECDAGCDFGYDFGCDIG